MITGMTFDVSCGIPQIEANRKMAEGICRAGLGQQGLPAPDNTKGRTDPRYIEAPVRNMFPMLAFRQLNPCKAPRRNGSASRSPSIARQRRTRFAFFNTALWKWTRKALHIYSASYSYTSEARSYLMHSLRSVGIPVLRTRDQCRSHTAHERKHAPLHRRCFPSTIMSHSPFSVALDPVPRRNSSSVRMAASGLSSGASGMSRTSLDRMSPIAGPPSTRWISLDEPPSSEMGRMNEVELERGGRKAPMRALQPVPPETTTKLVGGISERLVCVDEGAKSCDVCERGENAPQAATREKQMVLETLARDHALPAR